MNLSKRNWFKSIDLFWRLPKLKKINLFKVSFCLVLLKLTIRMLPFNKFVHFFRFLIRSHKNYAYTSERIFEITHNVQVVSNHLVFHSTCLVQALATKLLLRFDKNIVLIIGVCMHNGFEAHAWIEKDGNYIIGDGANSNFTPIWCLK